MIDLLQTAIRKIALATGTAGKLAALKAQAVKLAVPVRHGFLDRDEVVDRLFEQADNCGLVDETSADVITSMIATGLETFEQQTFEQPSSKQNGRGNSHDHQGAEAQQDTQPVSLCSAYVYRDPATLSVRAWIYGKHYIRKYVSATVGEGAVGKSSLSLTEAVTIVTGRPLLGKAPTAQGALRVWYWNGEDPKEEIELRLAAICQHYGIDGRDLEGKLFVDGRDSPIVLATIKAGTSLQLNGQIIQTIKEKLQQNAIDVWIIDPFVGCHSVPENDNTSMDALIKTLGRIAEEANCAIDIDHHTRKPSSGQDGLTINNSRGAGSIINGVRSGRIFNQMSVVEAEKAGLNPHDRKGYFRFDKAKANMAPAEYAVWHRLVPVPLPNGEQVAVVEAWTFPDAFKGVTTAHMHAVRRLVQEGNYRADIRAKTWVGYAVIQTLKLTRSKEHRTKAKGILKAWFENGVLAKEEREDPQSRKSFEFVIPGDWQE